MKRKWSEYNIDEMSIAWESVAMMLEMKLEDQLKVKEQNRLAASSSFSSFKPMKGIQPMVSVTNGGDAAGGGALSRTDNTNKNNQMPPGPEKKRTGSKLSQFIQSF